MKKMTTSALLALTVASASYGIIPDPNWSIARTWDEQILFAIRRSTPRPPVHARNLYHLSAAMYDAWATYDTTAHGVFFSEKHVAADLDADRNAAISFAAYRILKARFVAGNGPNIALIQADIDQTFATLGYDNTITSTSGNTPPEIGNRIAAQILAAGLADGSNEANNYVPNNGYTPLNASLPFKIPGTIMAAPDHWQPLAFDFLVLQNGEIVGAAIQAVICPHWENVKPFGLDDLDKVLPNNLYFDLGAPPGIGNPIHADDVVDMIAKSSQMDPRILTTIDTSPAVYHNSPLGTYDQPGYGLNPVTGDPYASNVEKVSDYTRALAEFWADGPNSETPPGHWHVVANDVSDTPGLELKIGGEGAPVDRLQWDVKMYLSVAGAAHDAAITAWGFKGFYDSVRPISFVRYLAGLGQSSDPQGTHYDPNGLPITPGLIEQVTASDVLPGGRFEDFPELVYEPLFGEPIGVNDHVGDLAVLSWTGGFNAGTTTGDITTGPLPGHILRGAGGAWQVGEFDIGIDDTPGALNAGERLPRAIQINEVRLDQPGNDTQEYIELVGPKNASLNGLTFMVIGDEVQTKVPDSQGRIQVAIDLTGKSLNRNGLFLIAKNQFTLATADLTTQFRLLEIGNCTYQLVTGYSGQVGQDLDFLDNGVLDVTPWTGIVDSIALRRKPGTVGIYSATVLGPVNSNTELYGVDWMLADRWMPYQASNFVTPPFPGYSSGHSTFSRSTAQALATYTGSPYFPDGFNEYVLPAGWLKFEKGPSAEVHLQWASYFDAADEAGVSRIWGGIHPRADDLPARITGDKIGKRAALRALALFEGIGNSPDVDADGIVGPADLAILLGAWGGGATSGADLDGDGTVGPADLAILLGAWS